MEELPFDPDLRALEEMMISQQWQESYSDDESEDDDTVWLLPDIPPGFIPAA